MFLLFFGPLPCPSTDPCRQLWERVPPRGAHGPVQVLGAAVNTASLLPAGKATFPGTGLPSPILHFLLCKTERKFETITSDSGQILHKRWWSHCHPCHQRPDFHCHLDIMSCPHPFRSSVREAQVGSQEIIPTGQQGAPSIPSCQWGPHREIQIPTVIGQRGNAKRRKTV